MRILIVEDDAELRKNVQHFLSGQGYAVDAAANGKEGLALARQIESIPGVDADIETLPETRFFRLCFIL